MGDRGLVAHPDTQGGRPCIFPVSVYNAFFKKSTEAPQSREATGFLDSVSGLLPAGASIRWHVLLCDRLCPGTEGSNVFRVAGNLCATPRP